MIFDGGYDPYYYDYSSTPDYYVSTPDAYVSTDDLAAEVQEELTRRGYDPGAIDGVLGPQTRSAIAAYQEDHGMAATGRIDRSLVRSLGL